MSARLLKRNNTVDRRRSTRRHTMAMKQFNKEDPIQLRGMTKEFGDFRAVDGLTLSIKKNEIIALLGHNGAGKTTAIYMLTGMLMPTGGDAIINGFSIRKETDMVRKNIGLCQQHDVLYDTLTVEQHLALAMRIRKSEINKAEEEREINEILRITMMMEHKNKMVKGLSGGMKRKLSLGMALIGETNTIILDEPSSGLDVESRQQVWELIRELKKTRSIIMSTQHIEEADELADRVCIMSHGKLIALGTPDHIKKRFGVGYNVYVEQRASQNLSQRELADKLDAVDQIFLNRRGYEGIVKSLDSTDKNSLFSMPVTLNEKISELIAEVEQRVPEMQVDVEMNSLEDAFIKIAEKDIEEEAKENKALAQAQHQLSEQEEQQAFDEYAQYTGEQSSMSKISVIFVSRLRLFYRNGFQWVLIFAPLLFVVLELFLIYAILESSVDNGDEDTPTDDP